MSFVLTRNGDRFEAGDPESYIPDIVSVAETLARIPRFNGHTNHKYSVAHHSVAGAMALEEHGLLDAARLFLVHDAHEMILGDVPSPVKPFITGFKEYEERLERHFMTSLAGSLTLLEGPMTHVKWMDHIIVAAEAQCLGLDDGWARDREEEYVYVAAKNELPPLALIRSKVEMMLPMNQDFVARLMVMVAEEMGLA